MNSHPVIGQLYDWFGLKPTRFQRFETPKVHGLAWVAEDGGVEFLAVASMMPGRGDFREFLKQVMEVYPRVRFWSVMSVRLIKALDLAGFTEGEDLDEYGEMCDCMEWRKK